MNVFALKDIEDYDAIIDGIIITDDDTTWVDVKRFMAEFIDKRIEAHENDDLDFGGGADLQEMIKARGWSIKWISREDIVYW